MNTKTNKTNTKVRRALASVALVGMGLATMFTATASAFPMDPIEVIEMEQFPLFYTTSVDLNECFSDELVSAEDHEGFTFEVEITNGTLSIQHYAVEFWTNDVADSSYTLLSDTVFELGVAPGESRVVFNDPHENVNVKVNFFLTGVTFFDEITRSCDQIAAEEATAEALAEAQAAATAAEEAAAEAAEEAAQAAEEAAQVAEEAAQAAEEAAQALAEAQAAVVAAQDAAAEDATEAAAAAAAAAEEAAQAAIAQAQAETEAAEAALAQAVAEKELALAQVETEKAKADAILAQSQANEETLENTPEDRSSERSETSETSERSETSDEELAVGEDLGEHSKSGMSGVVLGLIIVLGLVGVGAVTGAVLNLRKQR